MLSGLSIISDLPTVTVEPAWSVDPLPSRGSLRRLADSGRTADSTGRASTGWSKRQTADAPGLRIGYAGFIAICLLGRRGELGLGTRLAP